MSLLPSGVVVNPDVAYFNKPNLLQIQNYTSGQYLSTNQLNINYDTNISTVKGGIYALTYTSKIIGSTGINSSFIQMYPHPAHTPVGLNSTITNTLMSGFVDYTAGGQIADTNTAIYTSPTDDNVRISASLFKAPATGYYSVILPNVTCLRLN